MNNSTESDTMKVDMNLDDNEVLNENESKFTNIKTMNLRQIVGSVLAVSLTLVLGVVGLMMGMTVLLIGVGLAPFAALWLWFVTRRAAVIAKSQEPIESNDYAEVVGG